jgi:peptide/nickel transport system permease protein
MRIRFAKNKLAMLGLWGMVVVYIIVFLGEFIAPTGTSTRIRIHLRSPSPITFIGPNGRIGCSRIHSYDYSAQPDNFKFEFVVDKTKLKPIKFFVKGDRASILGFKTDRHLFGLEGGQRFYVFGLMAWAGICSPASGGRAISTTVGLLGVALSIIFGAILGTASRLLGRDHRRYHAAYYRSAGAPSQVPLWAALAAPCRPFRKNFTVVHRYFFITIVLSVVGWTGLARQCAKVLSYRVADFTQAALAAGSSDIRIILTHMIPNSASHIIVIAALSIPGMILGETALSFLGLGILPPAVSWGSLLRDAQQVSVVITHPWLLIPALAVIITVLLFSLLGDGSDAMDPIPSNPKAGKNNGPNFRGCTESTVSIFQVNIILKCDLHIFFTDIGSLGH